MSDSSDVQALEKISSEIGESQIRISLSSHCIKAQAFLFDKLRKQSERQKETCNFISISNLKLQTEIKQAELEIKSLLIAKSTIKSSNVELKKECLLVIEKRSEIEERIKSGEKKYEQMWLQAKSRYEGIPFVQNLLCAQTRTNSLKDDIVSLENKCENLTKEIKAKRQYLADLDKKRIIELADFMVNVMPVNLKTISENTKAINEVHKEVDNILKQQGKTHKVQIITNTPAVKQSDNTNNVKDMVTNNFDDGWFNIYENIGRESIMMPKIQFINTDFDMLRSKWDEMKTMKDDMVHNINITPSKRILSIETKSEMYNKKIKTDDDFSVYFNKAVTDNNTENYDKKKDNYSKRKLINILEDVKLDSKNTYKLMSKINPEELKGVEKIGYDSSKSETRTETEKEQGSEEIEEIDLTKKMESLLLPPTQFLDYVEGNLSHGKQEQVEVLVHTMSMSDSPRKNSQENIEKRKVSFDIPLTAQEITDGSEDLQQHKENIANETIDSQIDFSLMSNESYTKIKDMILKKHNLDLSPQFTYAKAKNSPLSMNSEKTTTSKFFQNNEDMNENRVKITELEKTEIEEKPKDIDNPNIETDIVLVSSPKSNLNQKIDRPVTGLLFNHGTQGIPDSLNVSISTTGFDDGDAEFPHCIDSSLLLSPKADIPLPMNGSNVEVSSQEVPNFLSGLRKTGFMFFGQSSTADPKSDTHGENQNNNFSFNFGGDEKKGRGGLFSMFR